MSENGGKVHRALSPAQIQARLEATQVSGVLTSGVALAVGSLLVDSYSESEHMLVLRKGATQRSSRRITLRHNGLTGADATVIEIGDASEVADTGTVDVTVDGELNGAGAAQVFRITLLAASSGWSYSLWRLPQKPPQTA